ncbi:extracellular solute-binding protein [Nocardioides jiangxiensis]|uniref:Extracellular solute-binding protein n=1 Tax=Nocardioides jiangxiensis TaxID=3064524 RepID=A0ABT9AXT5_9ACTN|nr:extracellular solute-binding protein [Nocardioides sp. WY-20]MDO7867379.1 extracellular solute-binding protein [Nocardioides sp. WY-20]
MRRTPRSVALVAAGLALASVTSGCSFLGLGSKPADLQVYSARHYGSEAVFKQFTKETGITVDFLGGENAELLQRIKAEGANSPADLYVTVDAGNLYEAAREGLLQPVDNAKLDAEIPAEYRDSQNRWFGLVSRARTVLYNPDQVKPSEFDAKETYAGLADPKWKGKLCMRDESEAYQVALVAHLINLYGKDRTTEIVKGWVANKPQIMANDKLLIEAVDAGTCDVALVNHYYVAGELEDNPDLNVKVYWASQQGAGTMVNISGAGVVKTSDNKKDAEILLEWLAGKTGQAAMASGNHEFPVNPAVKPDAEASQFGSFKPAPLQADQLGRQEKAAVEILDAAGYGR